GAGAPGLAAAVGPVAVARSIDNAAAATRAAVRAMVGASLPMIPSIRSDFRERVEHTGGGKDLRQDNGFAPSALEPLKRDACAAELLQQRRDFRILCGPIAFERDNAALGKGLAHRLAVERDPFVDQAGDAPGGG